MISKMETGRPSQMACRELRVLAVSLVSDYQDRDHIAMSLCFLLPCGWGVAATMPASGVLKAANEKAG